MGIGTHDGSVGMGWMPTMQPLLLQPDALPMNIIVNEELKAYIDPLTIEEYEALERSILAEGCRDALVLWNDLLVDGHNRYAICQAHGLPFQTLQSTQFNTIEDVHLWMIDQHLGRRSVSDFQRGMLALRKRQIMTERHATHRHHPARTPPPRTPAHRQRHFRGMTPRRQTPRRQARH